MIHRLSTKSRELARREMRATAQQARAKEHGGSPVYTRMPPTVIKARKGIENWKAADEAALFILESLGRMPS